ncbi:MAG: hypothetical protein HYX47_18475 [Burkholderiales bacterium]|nr:hypothetical protein [Burkholderiales bacterium]
MKTGGTRRDLMQTRYRSWTTTPGAEASYYHRVSWHPLATTRVIVQKIVRSTKLQGQATLRAYYWELWEVLGPAHRRTVYPYTIGDDTSRAGGGSLFYLSEGSGQEAALKGNVRFQVGSTVEAQVPFIMITQPTARRAPGAVEIFPDVTTVKHDVFTDKASEPGTFKIYGEVYELTLADCRNHLGWLNGFRAFSDDFLPFTAGILPARRGSEYKPKPEPTLTRYEAGQFVGRKGQMTTIEREFPSSRTHVTYPVSRAGTLVHNAPNQQPRLGVAMKSARPKPKADRPVPADRDGVGLL